MNAPIRESMKKSMMTRKWLFLILPLLFFLLSMESNKRWKIAQHDVATTLYEDGMSLDPDFGTSFKIGPHSALHQTFQKLGSIRAFIFYVRSDATTPTSYIFSLRNSDDSIIFEKTIPISSNSSSAWQKQIVVIPDNITVSSGGSFAISSAQAPKAIDIALALPARRPFAISDSNEIIEKPIAFSIICKPNALMTFRFYVVSQSHIIFALALAIFVLFSRRNFNAAATWAFFIVTLYLTLVRHPFSVIDEAAHFSYVTYIMDNFSIPLTTEFMPIQHTTELRMEAGLVDSAGVDDALFYEGVQGPLYYGFLAIFGKLAYLLTQSWLLTYYTCRVVGIALITAGFFYALKAYRFALSMLETKPITDNPLFVTAPFLAMIFCPSRLSGLVALTNDQLVFFLGNFGIYALMLVARQKSHTFSRISILAVACAFLWLTKLNGSFFFALCLGYMFYNARTIQTLCFAGINIVLVSPLYIYNWLHYHALTGIEAHIEFVRNILNPTGVQRTYPHYFSEGIKSYFFRNLISETITFIDPRLISAYRLIGVITFLGSLYFLLRFVKNLAKSPKMLLCLKPGPILIDTLVTSTIFVPFLALMNASHKYRIYLLNPRYSLPELAFFAVSLSAIIGIIPILKIRNTLSYLLICLSIVATFCVLQSPNNGKSAHPFSSISVTETLKTVNNEAISE